MTYCLALHLDEGIIFLSDSRTNAGLGHVGEYRKLHVLQPAEDRLFVIQSAGNLATTHEVLDRLDRDLVSGADESLRTVDHMFEAALYLGRTSQEVVAGHRDALAASGADGTCSFILGGQIGEDGPEVVQLYPEGNYVRPSATRPFLQIGDGTYGKFMLELGTRSGADLETSVKVALTSMLASARSNLSVGPPYDLGIYRDGAFALEEHHLDADSTYLDDLQQTWVDSMTSALEGLPPLPFDVEP